MAINFNTGLDLNDTLVSTYTTLPSDVYDATIKSNYFTKAMSGTTESNITLTINGSDKDFKLYVCFKETGTPIKTVNGNKIVMPGYRTLNSLVYCATGKSVEQLQQVPKTAQIKDWSTGETKPIMADALVGVEGKPIKVAIKNLLKHKNAKVNGIYVPTTETRAINEIDLPFNSDGFSASELVKGLPATMLNAWVDAHKGEVFQEKLKVTPIEPPKSVKEQALANAGTAVSIDDLLNDDTDETPASPF